ncbi:hypothetical protein OG203_15860 [Nocardia sp. NBC_01499]|uniref:hypothetical protein n=1 Tax=Nocardia sp. NBC_01499 TaxID=2903597 RepID=UPI003865A3B1
MKADTRHRASALLSRKASEACRPIQDLIARLGVELAAAVVAGDWPIALDRQAGPR